MTIAPISLNRYFKDISALEDTPVTPQQARFMPKPLRRTEAKPASSSTSTSTSQPRPAQQKPLPQRNRVSQDASARTPQSPQARSPSQRNADGTPRDAVKKIAASSERQQQQQPRDDAKNQAREVLDNNNKGSTAVRGSSEIDMLADHLGPMGEDNGIFELLLPDGDTLGVMVNKQPKRVTFMLTPSKGKFAERLRRDKMELEDSLGRRMGVDVKLTVL
jgi:hypothetical protein